MTNKMTIKKAVKVFVVLVITLHILLEIFEIVLFYILPTSRRDIKITLKGFLISSDLRRSAARIIKAKEGVFLKVGVENNTQETLPVYNFSGDITEGLYARGLFFTTVASDMFSMATHRGVHTSGIENILHGTREEIGALFDLHYVNLKPSEGGFGEYLNKSPGIYLIGVRSWYFLRKKEKMILQGKIKSNILPVIITPEPTLQSYLAFMFSPITQLMHSLQYDVFRSYVAIFLFISFLKDKL